MEVFPWSVQINHLMLLFGGYPSMLEAYATYWKREFIPSHHRNSVSGLM
jgi:hypothetical protein